MGNNTTLVTRPDVTSEEAILKWMTSISGVPEDRLYEGLFLNADGEPEPPRISLNEALWSFDPFTGQLLQLGVGAWSIFGIPILELRRNPIQLFQSILPEDRQVLVDLAMIKKYGDEISRDYRLQRKDGIVRWVRARAALVRNEAGKAIRVEGVIQDVTEERERHKEADLRMHRVQKQQQALERLFKDRNVTHGNMRTALRRITELAADGMDVDRVGIWMLDDETGRLSCSDLFEVGEHLHTEGLTLDLDRYPDYSSTLKSQSIISVSDALTDESLSEMRDDYLVPLNITSLLDTIIVKGGRTVGVVKHEQRLERREWMAEEHSFVSRVADQVSQMLERIEREEAERQLVVLQATIEQSPTGMVLAEFDGVINYCNQAFAGMHGYERDDVQGESIELFLEEDFASVAESINRKLSQDEGTVLIELTHKRRDGSTFPGLVNAGLIEDPIGGGKYIAVSLTDITERKNWEEVLKEERRRLKTLLASLPGMAFRIRNEEGWPVEFVSQGCVDLIGWQAEDIINNMLVSHADCVHPDDKQMVWKVMDKAFEARSSYEVEYRIIDAEGRVKWVWEQGLGVYEDDVLVAAEGFVCNITDRVEAHEALRGSETRYRELFDNMNSGVAVFNVNGQGERFFFKEYNKAGERMDGVTSAKVLGREVRDLFLGVVDSGLLDVFRRVWRTGDPEGLPVTLYDAGRLTSWRENYVYKLPSGEIVCVFEDVTEQIMAQQALRLKQISIDQANDAMIWTLPSGKIIDANDGACELYGYSSADLLTKSIFDLTTSFTPESWAKRWDKLRTTRSSRAESWHQRSDGRVLPVEVSTKFLEFEGQEFHCTIVRDLTEQKHHEAEIQRMNEELERRVEARTWELSQSQDQLMQSEKMAALGRLVAGVAHEINTPIGIGVTAASHLNDKIIATKSMYKNGTMKRSDFETFLSDADETSAMILSNLGSASRLIRGFKGVAVDQSDEARRIVVVKNYLEEVLLSLRPRLKRTLIDVRLDCPGDLVLDSYPGALSQTITNLVLNSLIHAFGEDESGVVTIDVRAKGDDLEITYADDGAGMASDIVQKLYEPFFTTRRGRGGSGLGMHVVYTAVTDVLGGHLTCESTPGEGTIFVITIPRERRRDDE